MPRRSFGGGDRGIAVTGAVLVALAGSARLVHAQPVQPISVSTTPAPVEPAPAPTLTRPDMPEDMRAKLTAFVATLRPDAERLGIGREVFDRALAAIEPDTEIFALLENQPEHVTAPWDYMNRLCSEGRIESGRRMLVEHARLLSSIEQRYGVDRHVVVAIWGIESNFGTAPGTRSVVRSLATLAVGDRARPQFWRSELLTALSILQRGDVSHERLTGSWAGAMGHTQFMPSSWAAHAADFDGDGKRDIWGSIPDALASTANYLEKSGWVAGEPWSTEVVLPAGFDFALSAPGVTKPGPEWQRLGIATPSGRSWPAALKETGLVLPAGARGPAFLVGPNFRAILKYNNATAYALAVGHLADRIAGAPPLATPWPTDDPPLAKTARVELQRRLTELGFDAGVPDGIVGANTRAAVRAWQRRNGLVEDGWAGERLLEKVRLSNASME